MKIFRLREYPGEISWYYPDMTKGNHNLAVKRTSIGLGLFALQDITVGKRIIEYTGPLISNEEAEERKFGKYFFRINANQG